MSSIAAALTTNGAPADAEATSRLLAVGRRDRLPAEMTVWAAGPCAMAAAGLHRQDRPCAERGHVRVLFDGRLDNRHAVRAALIEEGLGLPAAATDAEVVASAFLAWGADCAARFMGDFAWCAWDAEQRRLVVARDKCGVKPLYVAELSGVVFVASSLGALRLAPGVSSRLSDAAVCDFLLFGQPQDEWASCFADIARVPAAHVVTWTADGVRRAHRYWRLESPPVLRCRDDREYAEGFRDVLGRAVRDRVTEPRVGVLMSGGLDSSSIAALATDAVSPDQCLAITAVYDHALPDRERQYAQLVADALGIGIRHVPVDDYGFFARWETDARPIEPSNEPLTAIMRDLLAHAGCHSTVALCGEGGDPALLPGALLRQLGRVPAALLITGGWRALRKGLWPPLGLKTAARRWISDDAGSGPTWLSARLSKGQTVESRWSRRAEAAAPGPEPRTEALQALHQPFWSATFEAHDPNLTGQSVELRYPFFDERVLSFALSLPSYPWCLQKTVVREALAGRLPRPILRRRKAPVAGDVFAALQWSRSRLLSEVESAEGLEDFVDIHAFRRTAAVAGESWIAHPGVLEVACLATWLRVEAGRPAAPA